jgi:hypothetical protein
MVRKEHTIKRIGFPWGVVLIGLLFISGSYLILVYAPEFVKQRMDHWMFPAGEEGQIGDAFAGTVGPLIAWVAAILTFLAFSVQSISNRQQKRQFERQAADTARQRFENIYFELIRLFRENVLEIGIGENRGKKIFVFMIREYRAILEVAEDTLFDINCQMTRQDVLEASYYAFFFGTGPNSSRQLNEVLLKFPPEFVERFERTLRNRKFKKEVKKARKFKFIPFEGHQSRLGHYYRHLYQAVSYVHSSLLDIDKGEYVKMLRAQLTTHEQALLFLNSLSVMGSPWWKDGLLVDYKMVKNIPKNFFDPETEIKLEDYFPLDYFEWQTNTSSWALSKYIKEFEKGCKYTSYISSSKSPLNLNMQCFHS